MLLQILDFLIGILVGFVLGIIAMVKLKKDLWVAIYEEGKKKRGVDNDSNGIN